MSSTEGQGLESSTLESVMGKHPIAVVKLGGKSARCLIDTGSMVSVVGRSFFNKFLKDRLPVKSIGSYFSLTAANGLSIPYDGYVELEVQVGELSIKNRGILVLKQDSARWDFGNKCFEIFTIISENAE